MILLFPSVSSLAASAVGSYREVIRGRVPQGSLPLAYLGMSLPSLYTDNKSRVKQKVSHRHNSLALHALCCLTERPHGVGSLEPCIQRHGEPSEGRAPGALEPHTSPLPTCVLPQRPTRLHEQNINSNIKLSTMSGQRQPSFRSHALGTWGPARLHRSHTHKAAPEMMAMCRTQAI